MLARLTRAVRNFFATWRGEPVRLWVDGRHPAPAGWYWATTTEEAWTILTTCVVEDLSLGRRPRCIALVQLVDRVLSAGGVNYWPRNRPTTHSDDVRLMWEIDRLWPGQSNA